MNRDLTGLLNDFPYEPGRVNARIVRASDGRELLQVRVELGVIQMEVTGRPDGGGSLLGASLAAARRGLSATEAASLRLELGQLQQRAVAFLSVGEPARALQDCDAVLSGMELILERGLAADQEWAEGARFSVLVLRTRCAASALALTGRPRDAGAAIEAGLLLMRISAERLGIAEGFDALGDVVALRAMRDTMIPQLPPAQRAELESRLRAAVLAENYELAAILRDELRLL
jgi:UvrB/uvrC motif